ncbi:MAG: hypothetical protein Q8L29_01065 [archaeon]|nr:hypothetical protein [archaeon]
MRKTLGYILSGAALVGLILSFDPITAKLGIKLPLGLTTTLLTIISVAALILGLILLMKEKSSRQSSEVPIYHGKEIVGYRKIKK